MYLKDYANECLKEKKHIATKMPQVPKLNYANIECVVEKNNTATKMVQVPKLNYAIECVVEKTNTLQHKWFKYQN